MAANSIDLLKKDGAENVIVLKLGTVEPTFP